MALEALIPKLFAPPAKFAFSIAAGRADVFGAIIKDTATGQIIGHLQQTPVLQNFLQTALGATSFSPISAVSIIQNEQIKHSLGELQNGMLLMQNLQYGTLALSGLGLGVSIAGFAATLKKLNAIEKRLDVISEEIAQTSKDRRDDDLKAVFADVGADLQNVETLADRREPQRVAEQLQLSLSRAARRIEIHFVREADISTLSSMPLAQLDKLWSLAAAIRLCQEAAIQALFSADELETAQSIAQIELERQIALLRSLSPDTLSRLVSRGEKDLEQSRELRLTALEHARTLNAGIKGGVLGLAGQISLAQTLRRRGTSGIEYMRALREASDEPLLFLEASH